MTNASQPPGNHQIRPSIPMPAESRFWDTVDAVLARLRGVYVVLGAVLLVMSVQPEVYVGKAGPGLAVAGGLCFVASAIAHRSR